jgi:hypothetical protein
MCSSVSRMLERPGQKFFKKVLTNRKRYAIILTERKKVR